MEWLQLAETDLSKQVQDGELAWKVLQVRPGRAGGHAPPLGTAGAVGSL